MSERRMNEPRMNLVDDLIPVTDSLGQVIAHNAEVEPNPGSVVLTEGQFGTAWQRHFSDGLWHRVGSGTPRTWEWLLTKRNLLVAYDADRRAANAVPAEDTAERIGA